LGGNETPVAYWSLGWCGASSETDPKQVGFIFLPKRGDVNVKKVRELKSAGQILRLKATGDSVKQNEGGSK